MRKTFKLGKVEFSTYPLRYINLVSSLHVVSVCADESDPKTGVYPIIGRWYELSFFGQVFSLMVPANKPKNEWSFGGGGPVWSRSKRQWVFPSRRNKPEQQATSQTSCQASPNNGKGGEEA